MSTAPLIEDPLVLEFAARRPGELAALLGDFEQGELSEFFASLPSETNAAVSARLPSWQLTSLLGSQDPELICRMLLSGATDDTVALVAHLSESRYPAILATCPERQRRKLQQLFDYPSRSLAALVTTRFVRVSEETNCGAFCNQLAGSKDLSPKPILVVDRQGRYQGILNMQSVVSRSNRGRMVGDLAVRVVPLRAETDAESALNSRQWARHLELPVVDDQRRLLGVVSRAALERVAGDSSAEGFSLERLFTQLAVGYLESCSRLLESVLDRSR